MIVRLDMADVRDVIPNMMFLRFMLCLYSALSIGWREIIGRAEIDSGRRVSVMVLRHLPFFEGGARREHSSTRFKSV